MTAIGTKGEFELDFQLNNETYFLDISDVDEGQWLVFAQTPTGVRRIPVYVDAPIAEDTPVLVEDKHRRKIVN
jgi:hypothetical protein